MGYSRSNFLVLSLVAILSGCCNAPKSLGGYAYKISASPEVHVPKTNGQYFISIAVTNDSADTLCFARTGKTDGLTARLEVEISENAPVKLVSTDLSGISGIHLKKGRTIFGTNSPIQNTPIGFYLSPLETFSAREGQIRWKVVVSSAKAGEQRVVASGATKVRVRDDGESYLLISEQVPFPSRFESK